jgi:hypothetical protein
MFARPIAMVLAVSCTAMFFPSPIPVVTHPGGGGGFRDGGGSVAQACFDTRVLAEPRIDATTATSAQPDPSSNRRADYLRVDGGCLEDRNHSVE